MKWKFWKKENSLDSIKARVLEEASKIFPEYVVEIGADLEEVFISVNVFGVPREKMQETRRKIYNLEDEILQNSEYLLAASVKDVEFTAKYFPDKVRK